MVYNLISTTNNINGAYTTYCPEMKLKEIVITLTQYPSSICHICAAPIKEVKLAKIRSSLCHIDVP